MPRKRHTPEQIIGKLREAEVARRVVERCSKCAGPWASPSRLGDELLDGEIFYSLKEAEVLIERWRHHYNTVRPHSALGYRPPAPQPSRPNGLIRPSLWMGDSRISPARKPCQD